MSHVYNSDFYNYIEQGSRRSADGIIKILKEQISIHSVLDVGCGRGAWLSQWEQSGVEDIVGVDGDYVVRADFHVDAKRCFRPHDLSRSFSLKRKFDLAQCLEVAEHIDEKYSSILIESIVAHADVILFSAAQPGQGGENHINEKPLGFWRDIFAAHGCVPYDFVRPEVSEDETIMPWYRYNCVVYANETGAQRLSAHALEAKVESGSKLKPGGSLKWRLRRLIVSFMPRKFVDAIAVHNAKRISEKLSAAK